MRMHLAVGQYPPRQYEKGTHEGERMGTVFDVAMCDVREHDACDDEPLWRSLQGWTCSTASGKHRRTRRVRLWRCGAPGDNVPWDCGEHPALGHWHNDMSQTLQTHHVPPLPPGTKSPPPQLDSAVLISRRRN